MSLMNTLYVWFPASWGPSVVGAISKRNQTWLEQNPVQRDPKMFNATEVVLGPATSYDLQDSEMECQLRQGTPNIGSQYTG